MIICASILCRRLMCRMCVCCCFSVYLVKEAGWINKGGIDVNELHYRYVKEKEEAAARA